MRLTLRDLFWCILLIAALTAWRVEHLAMARRIRLVQQPLITRLDLDQHPNPAAIWRQSTMRRLSAMTAQRLESELAAALRAQQKVRYVEQDEYEACLAEVQRRGMTEVLERHYQALRKDAAPDAYHDDNLRVLTALRRSQGLPDPLRIQVSIADPSLYKTPLAIATLTNVDVKREILWFEEGGDYRGGRREKWRLVLTDAWGRDVENSNFQSMLGGGLSSRGRLAPGQSSRMHNNFDLRRYIAAPRSGKYWLQAFFHTSCSIADERDLTGLIVAQSEPIPVTVINPHDLKPEWFPTRNRPMAAILAATVLLAALNHWFSKKRADAGSAGYWSRLISFVSRDACWAVVIVVVTGGYWWDRKSQEATLQRLKPDALAEWSIRFGHDAPSRTIPIQSD